MLNERSDVYSFGVLVMEIITGRAPVDYNRPHDEVHLVMWLKTMVSDRRTEEVLDPKIPERPTAKALKRALLVALRCVDPDSRKRPKMGHVIHMFEMDELLLNDVCTMIAVNLSIIGEFNGDVFLFAGTAENGRRRIWFPSYIFETDLGKTRTEFQIDIICVPTIYRWMLNQTSRFTNNRFELPGKVVIFF